MALLILLQVRRLLVTGLKDVNYFLGHVNFTKPASSIMNTTMWPGVYATTFASGSPITWYMSSNPLSPQISTLFPEMGIQFTFVHVRCYLRVQYLSVLTFN